MELLFLGTGDAFGTGGRFNTCFFLRTNSFNALLDCGGTSLQAMKRSGLTTEDVDMIFISHFHGDHFGGLPYFILEAGKLSGRTKPLIIASPPGCSQRLEVLIGQLYPGSEDVLHDFPIEYISFSGRQQISRSGFELHTFPVEHTPETFPHAYRIKTGGKAIAFSGDTSWTPVLPELAADCDVFICECNFYSREGLGHLSYLQIERERHLLEAERVFLTHFGPEMMERSGKHLAFEEAEDGMLIRF